MNNDAINMGVKISPILLDKYPEVGMLILLIVLFVISVEITNISLSHLNV